MQSSDSKISETIVLNPANALIESLDIADHDEPIAEQKVVPHQFVTHTIQSGLNPLVDAAAYLFSIIGKLKHLKSYRHLHQLHKELVNELNVFQETAKARGYSSEYILVGRYALCSTLDDVISNTAWGSQGQWDSYNLLSTFNQESSHQDRFFVLLERVIKNPTLYIDVMELMYLCLSLGFKGKYRHSEFGHIQLDQIIDALYKRIRAYRGNIHKTLSPFPFRPWLMDSVKQPISSKGWLSLIIGMTLIAFLLGIYVSALKGLYFTLFIALSCALKWLLWDLKSVHKMPLFTLSRLQPEIRKKCHALENRFKGAVTFLNKTKLQKRHQKMNLTNLPWFLCIGTSGSGKTSLFSQSGVNYILSKSVQSDGQISMNSKDHCDWWVTRDLVVLDVPGSYVSPSSNKKTQSSDSSKKGRETNELWKYLLSLIHKYRPKQSIQGVLVTLPISKLIKPTSRYRSELIHLKNHLMELMDQWGETIPLHVVLTHCDAVTGFSDFFSEYSAQELFQTWGIALPKHDFDKRMGLLSQRFDALIKRLNHQLIWRLHQERNISTRSLIKDFPLQWERSKESILQGIKLVIPKKASLYGIYLTSAQQEPEQKSNFYTATQSHSHALQLLTAPPLPAQSYFIRQLIQQTLIKSISSE